MILLMMQTNSATNAVCCQLDKKKNATRLRYCQLYTETQLYKYVVN